jgi:hypothetical protein
MNEYAFFFFFFFLLLILTPIKPNIFFIHISHYMIGTRIHFS